MSLSSKKLLILGLLLILALSAESPAVAETINDLRSQIAQRNQQIAQIEAQIAQYEKEIEKTQGEATSLAAKIKELETTRLKLAAQIKATEEKIKNANLSIEELELEIEEASAGIDLRLTALAETLRRIERELSNSLVEVVLSVQSISQSLDQIEATERLQTAIRTNLEELKSLKLGLEANRAALIEARNNLNQLRQELTDQKTIAEINKRNSANLLTETKNREISYKKLLIEKVALREKFERELADYESQLRFALDPESLPERRAGVLAYPVKNVYITQYFGLTSFARANPQVYNGRGHNGIDFRASLGTEVFAAEAGEVLGTGDTDLGCPSGSYGRWVLIKHPNGLASAYGHLSLIKVKAGQEVGRGELIGYSGNSGYSVGPHLHFTVFAGQAVKIGEIIRPDSSKSKCGPMPLSAYSGYLNPLDYL